MLLASKIERLVQERFAEAGITLNGSCPWDIKVKNDRFYKAVAATGSLGLGESYMNEWIDIDRVDDFMFRVMKSPLGSAYESKWSCFSKALATALLNKQTKKGAKKVCKHYNVGNDLYKRMLDKRMQYTCAYWKEASNLDEAQEAKLDLVCKKIGLKPGMKILDLGCGWGGFARYAAEKYGASVVALNISEKQVELGRELSKGLPVEIRQQDYRDIAGSGETFDHVVSIGMTEHVGPKNYRTLMETVSQVLKDDGLFLLHTIGNNTPVAATEPWIEKYIFPNGYIPAASQLIHASEHTFVTEDWHNFGPDYDKTLMAWHQNFENSWHEISHLYDERFYRMWRYYLLACAGAFRARSLQLWQIVYSKHGIAGGYRSIR